MRHAPKKLISLALALVLALSLAAPCFAEYRNTVRMGFFEFGGMFEGASDGAVKRGYCYEYMMQISAYTGWNYEFVYGSYAELYDKLRRGEIDILPYTNKNETREREVLFSDQALAEEEYYIAAPEGSSAFREGLSGKKISTIVGADYNDLLLEYIESKKLDVKVVYFADVEDTWEAVRNGTVDAAVYTSNAFGSDGWKCVAQFGVKPTYTAVSKNRPDLLRKLDEASAQVINDDPAFLGALYDKYFSSNPMRSSLTETEQRWVKAHPVLHVGGFSNDTVDLEIMPDGTAKGLTVDIINGIIERLGLDATADYRCFDTIEEMEEAMDAGEIDVFYPFYPNYYVAQQHGLTVSNNVRTANMELVYRETTPYEAALTKVATPETRLGVFYVSDFYPESEIVGSSSVADAVGRMMGGKALGAIAYNEAIHPEMEKHQGLTSVILLEGCGTCFAARPHDHALIMILNRGLNYFDSAEISAITAKNTKTSEITTLRYFETHKEMAALIIVILVSVVVLSVALIQVSRLKVRADEASKAKSTFLFNMSHDIRTPMNAITGFTDKAIRHRDDPKVLTESLTKVKTSSEYLLKIVNDILDMAKIESGKLEINEKLNCLDDGNRTVTEMFGAEAARKGIELRASFDTVHEYVWFDGDRMLQIIANLLSNSIKYTNEGGVIDYSVTESPSGRAGYGKFTVTVKDTGIGMTPEFVAKIFDAFEREETATKSGAQGTGLGMAIVKRLADAMGSTLDIESEKGVGTKIALTSEHRIATDAEIEEYLREKGEASVGAAADFSGKRVLLVEDNELNREIATDILDEQGLVIETAVDGTEAVEIMREKGPRAFDFILMDIQMPVMNGYEATKAIRDMYPGDHIPIIALSANAFEEDRNASLEAGMDGHVAKPINVRELFETLSRFL